MKAHLFNFKKNLDIKLKHQNFIAWTSEKKCVRADVSKDGLLGLLLFNIFRVDIPVHGQTLLKIFTYNTQFTIHTSSFYRYLLKTFINYTTLLAFTAHKYLLIPSFILQNLLDDNFHWTTWWEVKVNKRISFYSLHSKSWAVPPSIL